MKLIIDDKLLERYGVSLEEFLYLMLLDLDSSTEIIDTLEKKGWLVKGHLTEISRQRLAAALNKTKEEPSTDSRIDNLVERLMNIFPKGKKEGTAYYWRGNRKEIKDKLLKFFVYFGDTYTDGQIANAAQKYVDSFNGNYTYMRLLKYFIWKNDKKATPEGLAVEQVSELASYIENEGQEDHDNDWSTQLI